MRTIWLTAATALLLLSACDQAPDPAAKQGAPMVTATTNAKVEPAPTGTPASATEKMVKGYGEMQETASGDTCGALLVGQFVGRQDRPTTRADLVKAVGHDNIRWIGPDDPVTRDLRPERLNVLLDKTKRLITGARCG